jgi:chaperonin GroEL
MTTKELTMGHEAHLSLRAGVDVLADAVKVTLGPSGRSVVLEQMGRPPHLTQDGVSVARTIELRDRIQNAAVQIVQQAAQRTADDVGDGTTTATVLAQAIIREGLKHLAVGVDASRLKCGIDQATSQILDALAAMSMPCRNMTALRQVATLAANGDEDIGQLVTDALHEVGPDGVAQIEAGRGLTSTLHLVKGVLWDVGFASPRFATDTERQGVRLERPRVLVVTGTLDDVHDLIALLESIAEANEALVIVAEDFSDDVMSLLVVNASIHSIRVCALKAPGVGDRRRAALEDLALAVGCAPFDPALAHRLGELQLSQLGGVERFECDARKTVFVGGRGDTAVMEAHLNHLRRRVQEATDEREALQKRAALLGGAVAVIQIGAATELEYQERVARTEDALRAARAALREGVVPGGGVAYLRARSAALAAAHPATAPAHDAVESDPDVAAGVATLASALQQPFLQIMGNAGIEALPVLAQVEQLSTWEGFNAATGSYGTLQGMGIVDATSVVRSALRHAASAAGMLLTTECVVTHA